MRQLLLATGNKGKKEEIAALVAGVVEQLFSLSDFPGIAAVVEDGETFVENACKKAKSAASRAGIPAVADDSGLVVDALGGRPGVFSARFAGEGATDLDNNHKLLEELAACPDDKRTAAFHCVTAICYPDGTCHTFQGQLHGLILREPRGGKGFGYDPLFLVPEYGLTLAELPLEVKNGISHRGNAFRQLLEYLKNSGPRT